ncbi:MAG TPA: ABC transporter substrate-binding protein [Candidatus Limnocylindria bacterium]|nr:ABC transporter substrate-binding protein [Candidatus Limnocylindria bacterium]
MFGPRLGVVLAVVALLMTACGGASTGGGPDWKGAADVAKAKAQAVDFQTYGMPDSWANYGESIDQFCKKNGFTCKRTDTDMSSNEEITRFDAEKNNPVAVFADIGLLYGPVAEKKGVVPNFLPPSASKLPDGFKAKTGGWIATFTGVPGFIVNTDVIKNVPQTWDDLLKPEYKGKIGMGDPRKSGTAATSFLAWAYAHGGSEDNLQPGVDFAKKLLPNIKGVAEGNAQTLEKGEVPIQIKYDFNLLAAQTTLKGKGVNAEVIIPGVSVYAPSGLMLNTYNTAKMDLIKMFAEWVLTDEGQTVFAKFGARPVRYITGDLKLSAEAKTKWLPDDRYKDVKQVNDWSKVDPAKIAEVWDTQVLAGQ